MRVDPIRNDGLDLLRATGAALVFAGHLSASFGVLADSIAGGRLGVYVFFPLSGYLLYRPFIEGRVDLRRYAQARALRIVPAYYLALVGLALLGQAPLNLPTLTFTANTFALREILESGFGQSWTLGVEVAFYALLPLLERVPGRWLVGIMVASWLLSLGVPETWLWSQFPAQLWAFGLGMLVARHRIPTSGRVGVAVVVAGLLLFPNGGLGYTIVAVGTMLLIGWARDAQPQMRWARWPANISYSVYLWHIGITTMVAPFLSGPALVVVAVLLVGGIAALSWRYVERPILRWVHGSSRDESGGDRRIPSPAPPQVAFADVD